MKAILQEFWCTSEEVSKKFGDILEILAQISDALVKIYEQSQRSREVKKWNHFNFGKITAELRKVFSKIPRNCEKTMAKPLRWNFEEIRQNTKKLINTYVPNFRNF